MINLKATWSFVFSSPYKIFLLFQIIQPSTKSNMELRAVFDYTISLLFSHIASFKTSFQMIRLEAFPVGMVTFIWIWIKLGYPSRHQANLYLMKTGKFVDQSIAFCKASCILLLSHEVIKSDLIKGLSSFDPSVIFEGSEEHYTASIEKLAIYFVARGCISASDKTKATNQYRSFVTKLRHCPVSDNEDWIGCTTYRLTTRFNVVPNCINYTDTPVSVCLL